MILSGQESSEKHFSVTDFFFSYNDLLENAVFVDG